MPLSHSIIRYAYDPENQVLIKIPRDDLPMLLKKGGTKWRYFDPNNEEDEYYRKAIHMGLSVQEGLTTIEEDQVQDLLRKWACLGE